MGNYPKLGSLKQQTFTISRFLWVGNLGVAWQSASGSGCSQAAGCGAAVMWRFHGHWTICLQSCSCSCWQEIADLLPYQLTHGISRCMGASLGCPGVHPTWHLVMRDRETEKERGTWGWGGKSAPEVSQDKSHSLFVTQSYPFCLIISIRKESLGPAHIKKRQELKEWIVGSRDHWGIFLEVSYCSGIKCLSLSLLNFSLFW